MSDETLKEQIRRELPEWLRTDPELRRWVLELDVIVTNGTLIICELKSSIDKAGMYSFERKARFYERRHNRTANRLMVISPMIDARAQKVADKLGIETYGDSLDVESL